MRVEPIERPEFSRLRKPRIASEKADIEYLLAALNSLSDLVTTDVLGMPGSGVAAKEYPLLRRAIWSARQAAYRVVRNKTERAKRTKPKRRAAA